MSERLRSDRKTRRTGAAAVASLLLAPAVWVFIGWGLLHAIGAAVCSSYNFISNDLCDRWRFDPPPEDAVPVPEGWTLRSSELSCGSGGCPTRVHVIEAPSGTTDALRSYVGLLQQHGWTFRRYAARSVVMYSGEKDGLRISARSPVADRFGSVPPRLRTTRHVEVGVSLVDELRAAG